MRFLNYSLTVFFSALLTSTLSVASPTSICNVYVDATKPFKDPNNLNLVLVYGANDHKKLNHLKTNSAGLEKAIRKNCPMGVAYLDPNGESLIYFKEHRFISSKLAIRSLGVEEQKALLFSNGDKSHLLIGKFESLYKNENKIVSARPNALPLAIVSPVHPTAHAVPVNSPSAYAVPVKEFKEPIRTNTTDGRTKLVFVNP